MCSWFCEQCEKTFSTIWVACAFGWSSYMTQLPVNDLYHRHLPKYLAPSLLTIMQVEKGTDILWGPVGTPKFHLEKYQLCQLCWIYGYVIPQICGKVSQANLDKTWQFQRYWNFMTFIGSKLLRNQLIHHHGWQIHRLQTACGLSDKYGMHNKDTCQGDISHPHALWRPGFLWQLPHLSETLDQWPQMKSEWIEKNMSMWLSVHGFSMIFSLKRIRAWRTFCLKYL